MSRNAFAVQERLKDYYIPNITSITYEDKPVEPPVAVPWYPDQLAYSMATSKNIVRRFPPFAEFQKFLVSETAVGNISRQEIVSMIPPLLLDVRPGMTVLDLCAAPGSKSAQLMELIHAGEEDRIDKISEKIAANEDARKQGNVDVSAILKEDTEGFADDGRSTGLLVANDVDYKRAHMLIHQMKRLNSPNLLVTNHDATMFPSLRLPTESGSAPKVLKFDRVLADVPCTGDGTVRKNLAIWKDWTPGNAMGLHAVQCRILTRSLQMLKVHGRAVYSTCSMNPVENEAVVASVIDRCGGPHKVRIVDCSTALPGLVRSPGLKQWNIVDKAGRTWNSYEEVKAAVDNGETGLTKIAPDMFAPTIEHENEDFDLSRCMRVYPHQQNTGGFFITVLEKKTEFKARSEKPQNSKRPNTESSDATPKRVKQDEAESKELPTETADDAPVPEAVTAAIKTESASKPESSAEAPAVTTTETAGDAPVSEATKPESEPQLEAQLETTTAGDDKEKTTAPAEPKPEVIKKRKPGQPLEEPFKYIDPNHSDFVQIYDFYDISPQFPRDRFMVRNVEGRPAKTVYYTSALARDLLVANEGSGIKFVHCGVKMFVKQDVQSPEVCPWRIQSDGLQILNPWIGPGRVVTLHKKEILKKLLVEMFPKVSDGAHKELGEIGEYARDVCMGCCILRVEPEAGVEDSLADRMILPLWRSRHSLSLMLPKEERRAMLLRIFNDDTPLINTTQKQDEEAAIQDVAETPATEEPEAASEVAADVEAEEK